MTRTCAGVTNELVFKYLVVGSTENMLMFFCMFSGVVCGRSLYKLSLQNIWTTGQACEEWEVPPAL